MQRELVIVSFPFLSLCGPVIPVFRRISQKHLLWLWPQYRPESGWCTEKLSKTTSLMRLSLQMWQSAAFCVFFKSSIVITGDFFFPRYACILLSSSRTFSSKTFTACSLLYWASPKSFRSFWWFCKRHRMANVSLFLLWSFGLLAVCSLANTWSRRISRTALSSACESFWTTACYLHAWAALLLLALQLPFAFGFLPFIQILCCLAVQTAFAAVFAVESPALVIK